jgi:hypothetical protein
MSTPGPLPLALRMVALLFLFQGICSVITIVVCALNNRLQLDFGFLGIFIYFGLLRLSSGWRTCALVLTWIGLLLIPIVMILSLGAPHANINFFGITGPEIPPFCVFLASFFWFGLALWQLKVLNRPDVTALFIHKKISEF